MGNWTWDSCKIRKDRNGPPLMKLKWSSCIFLCRRRMHTYHQQRRRRERVTAGSVTADSREIAGFAISG
jgi:hypothetical protein